MAHKKVLIKKAKIEGIKDQEEIKIEDAVVEGVQEKGVQEPMKPTTTLEEDTVTAGQRKINLIWEITQAILSIMIAGAMIYCIVKKIDTRELAPAFFMVITMYLIRTNHTKVGGVTKGQTGR